MADVMSSYNRMLYIYDDTRMNRSRQTIRGYRYNIIIIINYDGRYIILFLFLSSTSRNTNLVYIPGIPGVFTSTYIDRRFRRKNCLEFI